MRRSGTYISHSALQVLLPSCDFMEIVVHFSVCCGFGWRIISYHNNKPMVSFFFRIAIH